jgi:hypothetical protein
MRGALPWLAVPLFASCGQPPPPAPSAVISASPESVCYGDATTQIVLDASGSAPRLTLIPVPPDPGEAPLQFQWSFSGDAYVWADDNMTHGAGTLVDSATNKPVSNASVTVNLVTATRPLHVTLRVQNGEGGVTEALKTITITLPDPSGQCPLPPQ